MTQSNNDIEELEELLTELEGQEAQLVRPYAEDDDAVTQLMDAPLGDQEWMVQVTALDRRMMSTDQVLAELRAGKLSNRTLVWRGGMDDWLPISRVDSLGSGASRVGMSQGGMPAAARIGAPAPLPSPPMWATLPSAAPLPPPPTALPPVVSSGVMAAPSVGLPPAAAAPLPPPPSEPSSPRPVSLPPPPPTMMSSSNTARPVAIDFSEMVEDTSSPLRGKRAILALSAVAVLAVFVSVYALSSKSDATATAATASTEQPRSVAALQPAMEKKAEPTPAPAPAAKPAEPVAAPTPAPKASENELAANDTSASSGSSARTTAPARYSPRSEYRRRSRGGAERQDDSEASESAAVESPAPRSPATRAAVAARAPAEEEPAAPSEPAAAPVSSGASDDADATEAPKSTGGKSNTFNREAAKAALAEAAAQAKNCRPAGGPNGTGRVQVHYEPSGKVSKVDILTGKFENTTTGSCVVMLFRRAKVPEFTGAPVVTVSKSFEIP
jgi:hypothetical protein